MQTYDQRKGGNYAGYGATNDYELVSGMFALPVALSDEELAAGASPVAVVEAHKPYRKRHVTFDAKKNGSPPVLPSPESTGAFIFLEGHVVIPMPTFDSSMTGFVWEAAGEYTFIETVPSRISDGFLLNTMPFATAVQKDDLSQGAPGIPPGTTGAIAQSGAYGQAALQAASSISSSGSPYSYNNPSFWPGVFFNSELVNGGSAV